LFERTDAPLVGEILCDGNFFSVVGGLVFVALRFEEVAAASPLPTYIPLRPKGTADFFIATAKK
jgi:hypothetical protein